MINQEVEMWLRGWLAARADAERRFDAWLSNVHFQVVRAIHSPTPTQYKVGDTAILKVSEQLVQVQGFPTRSTTLLYERLLAGVGRGSVVRVVGRDGDAIQEMQAQRLGFACRDFLRAHPTGELLIEIRPVGPAWRQ
jgi:hypothetical protein